MKNKSKQDAKTPQPMDPSITENREPVVKPNQTRACWAIKTLNEEVWALFPETPVEYSDHDGRNTALSVTYDLTSLDSGDNYDFTALIRLIEGDPRVREVIVNSTDGAALVSMHASARTQDRRDSFGLADALDILGEPGSDEGFFEEPVVIDAEPVVIEGGSASDTTDDVFDGGEA